MPGVADQVKKTQLRMEHKARQSDMQELLRMVKEGRLHEADALQLETLKVALELNTILEDRQVPQEPQPIPSEELVAAVKQAIAEGMLGITTTNVYGRPEDDPERPKMGHTSLADLKQADAEINIAHRESVSRSVKGQDSAEQLETLRRLKKDK